MPPFRLGCALLLACGSNVPRTECPAESSELPEAAESSDVEPAPSNEVAAEPDPVFRVEAGRCNLAGVPEAMRVALSEEDAREVRELVSQWMQGRAGFAIVPRAGIQFAKSEDDSGADPPYPTFVAAQGHQVCGVQTHWLATALRETFRGHSPPEHVPVRCSDNVCCYTALMEFDSAGGIVLEQLEYGWRLQAAYEVADNGTITQETIDANYRVVHDHLRDLASEECAQEPAHPGG
ncbi:MAG: hypothetical protein AAGE52_25950 [Myxococcota bacterium]